MSPLNIHSVKGYQSLGNYKILWLLCRGFHIFSELVLLGEARGPVDISSFRDGYFVTSISFFISGRPHAYWANSARSVFGVNMLLCIQKHHLFQVNQLYLFWPMILVFSMKTPASPRHLSPALAFWFFLSFHHLIFYTLKFSPYSLLSGLYSWIHCLFKILHFENFVKCVFIMFSPSPNITIISPMFLNLPKGSG